MSIRIPALDDESCPHCHACNHGTTYTVWRVADERGLHFQCDCCSFSWPPHHGAVKRDGKGHAQ